MRRTASWGAVWNLVAVLATIAGCGCVEKMTPTNSGAATGGSSEPAPAASDGAMKRAISLHGSSTVYPIAQAVAEKFKEQNPDVEIGVGSSGTGGGFKKFVTGEIDICNASRPITAEEVEKCKEHKIEWVEVQVAIDGLTVVVHPENTFCNCLTVAQLKQLWEPNSQISKWKQLNPEWPDEAIELYGADVDSGTFDYFTEVIVGKAKSSRTNYTPATNDNVLVQGVANSKFSLGYFGYGYFEANTDRLKAVAIKAGDDAECVAPTPEAILKGTYTPLSRPLFIYVNRAALKRPDVAKFVSFFLTDAGQQAVSDRKFIRLDAATTAAMLQRLTEALTASK